MTETYEVNIVGHDMVDPADLLANPRNFRMHPRAQKKNMRAILRKTGWVDGVMVNRRTGHIVDGHMRTTIALEDEIEKIPVDYIDVDEETEKIIIATYDQIGAGALRDRDLLKELLDETDPGEDKFLADFLGALGPNSVEIKDKEATPAEEYFDPEDKEQETQFMMMVICESAEDREDLIARLTDEGYVAKNLGF